MTKKLPQMSAQGVADEVVKRIDSRIYDFLIVVNFANADMVGHTGNLQAAIKAAEFCRCEGWGRSWKRFGGRMARPLFSPIMEIASR